MGILIKILSSLTLSRGFSRRIAGSKLLPSNHGKLRFLAGDSHQKLQMGDFELGILMNSLRSPILSEGFSCSIDDKFGRQFVLGRPSFQNACARAGVCVCVCVVLCCVVLCCVVLCCVVLCCVVRAFFVCFPIDDVKVPVSNGIFRSIRSANGNCHLYTLDCRCRRQPGTQWPAETQNW